MADTAARSDDLATLGRLVSECLLADLPEGLRSVVAALAERTARQHDVLALLGAPVDAEQPQPVQQHRAGSLALPAQVHDDGLRRRGGLEPDRPLLALEVRRERDHRRPFRDGAQLATDDQRVVNQGQRHP